MEISALSINHRHFSRYGVNFITNEVILVEKRFVKAAQILCIVAAIALIGVLIRRSNNSEEYIPALAEKQLPPTGHNENNPTSYTEYTTEEYEELPPTQEYIPVEEEPPPSKSPSDLQLALFANMAFFPFDFAEGELPGSPQFNSFHYRPFKDYVITSDPTQLNQYGFSFAYEMKGWYKLLTHHNPATEFSITIFSCANGGTIILAIRGTDGNIRESLQTQTGTWWCNFRALSGVRHPHVYSLTTILHDPAMLAILDGADIYITGHSLGGYLTFIATYELARLGFEDNIQRVVAFSAPIFTVCTLELVSSLSPATRSKMTHYYVIGDLIAGSVGVKTGEETPEYGTFTLANRLFNTMKEVRNIDVPPAIYAFSNLMVAAEGLLPFRMPQYMTDLLWWLYGAMGQEALEITHEFRQIIHHVPVAQTWHTPRPEPSWPENASLRYILRNYTPELAGEIAVDMVIRIFDVDTHFMMNFYPYLIPNLPPS